MKVNLNDVHYIGQIQADLKYICETQQGKRIMDFLEYICGYNRPCYDPTNSTTILLADGKREVILTLKTIMNYKPEDIVEMLRRMAESAV